MEAPLNATETIRHFSCAACGKCCTRAPEMELGEATALADKFITRLIFKLHTLPLDTKRGRAMAWWKRSGSALPVKEALEEVRAHITLFSVDDVIDRDHKRTLHLTLSALPIHENRGACPHLIDARCAIYDVRPLTCRTTPFHYSRPASTLTAYLDRFTKTPGYLCDTSEAAPAVLKGEGLAASELSVVRDEAFALTTRDRKWKQAIVAQLKAGSSAFGLPTYGDVLRNSDAGGATTVSMKAAWAVATQAGLMTQALFEDVCVKQLRLLRSVASGGESLQSDVLHAMLDDYESTRPDRSEVLSQPTAASCLA